MVPLLVAAKGLARARHAAWRDLEAKALTVVAGALILTGTLFSWRFKDWTFIEPLYFCIVTVTTVGYFGVLVALLTSVAQQYLKHKTEPRPARPRRRARRQRDRPTEDAAEPTDGAVGTEPATPR